MRCPRTLGRRSSSCVARAPACGTPRAGSTWTSSPGCRSTTPAIATQVSSPRSAGRRAAWEESPTSTTPSRRCGSASGLPSRAWAAGSSSATRARRRTSASSSWPESTRTGGGSMRRRSSSWRAPFMAARSARWRRHRGSPAKTCSDRCRRASSRSRVTILGRSAPPSASTPPR